MFNLKEKFLSLFSKKIKCIFLNGTITCTLISKQQLVFTNMTKKEYEVISKFTTDEEVREYYEEWVLTTMPQGKEENVSNTKIQETKDKEVKQIVEKKENKEIIGKYTKLITTGDFEEVDGQLFLKPIKLSIPKLLIQKFTDIIDSVLEGNDEDTFEEYHALKNFWKWASLAPDPRSREDLFNYLEVQGLEVNKFGMFFGYRKVQSTKKKETKGDPKLVKFISESYLKIKTQKKAPKNFTICKGIQELSCILTSKLIGTEIQLGNLQDLYSNLGNLEVQDQMFTDAHTGTFNIRIGYPVTEAPEKCNFDNREDCGAGLHLGAKDFGCGDTSILVLVNPMHSVSVPVSNCYKMRVSEYFPVAILDNKQGFDFHKNENVLELGTEYFNEQLEKLNSLVKNNKPVELVKHHLLSSQVTEEQINKLEFTIPDIKMILEGRVINS